MGAVMDEGAYLLITPIILSIIILFPVLYQHNENKRRVDLLDLMPDGIKLLPIFQKAINYLQRRTISKSNLIHVLLPISILVIYIIVYFYISLYGLLSCKSGVCDSSTIYRAWLSEPNLILGGAFADLNDKNSVFKYQLITATCGGIAFAIIYILILSEIIISVNQNNAGPFIYWFSIMRMIIASILAGVLRNFSDGSSLAIATLGVASAMVAYLGVRYIFEIFQDAFAKTPFGRAFTVRNLTKTEYIPDAMPLCLIDGMNEQVQAKLNLIGVQDCSGLANGNPLLIWAMTGYNLLQICDWIDQALLVIHIRPEGKSKTLAYGVKDLSCFEELINRNKDLVANLLYGGVKECVEVRLKAINDCENFNNIKNIKKNN
jgi:hypothetical protein